MNKLVLRRVVSVLCTAGFLASSSSTMAAGFQIWEQDAAGFAHFHAGYAALANNASIAWYNPAGITRIKNQQLLFGSTLILTDFKYRGTVDVPTIDNSPQDITAQGGSIAYVPALHYVAPINDWMGFGFSITIPFGLKTDYNKDTILRYAATLTSARVIDFSPVIAFKVTDKFSLGIGPDLQRMYGEFNTVAGIAGPENDTVSVNRVNDTAYGYHLGGLYEFSENTRVGASYHSQVVHHLTGTSRLEGPIAEIAFGDDPIIQQRAKVNMTLPAYIALSAYHRLNSQWAFMATLTHTQWSTFKSLTINGAVGIIAGEAGVEGTKNLSVTIPQNFRNTLNLSIGTDYTVNEQIILRAGIGYDQSPVKNKDRNVQLPDNNRYVFAFGGHLQATKTIGLDAGWTHLFIKRARISPPPQKLGLQTVTTNGYVNGSADVYSLQLVWDIA